MPSTSAMDDVPFGLAAGAGAAAWLLGYLCTFLITSGRIRDSLFGQVSGIPTWKIVGWVFYNAHFVDTVVDLPFLGESAVNGVGGQDGFTAAARRKPTPSGVG